MLLKPLHPPDSELWLAEAGKLRLVNPGTFNNYVNRTYGNVGVRGLHALRFISSEYDYHDFINNAEMKVAGDALIKACRAFAEADHE